MPETGFSEQNNSKRETVNYSMKYTEGKRTHIDGVVRKNGYGENAEQKKDRLYQLG